MYVISYILLVQGKLGRHAIVGTYHSEEQAAIVARQFRENFEGTWITRSLDARIGDGRWELAYPEHQAVRFVCINFI